MLYRKLTLIDYRKFRGWPAKYTAVLPVFSWKNSILSCLSIDIESSILIPVLGGDLGLVILSRHKPELLRTPDIRTYEIDCV